MADVMDATNQERAKRVAVERIVGFAKQFDEIHLNLASHAAFPLVLTPDLLYQIWAHFVPEAPWSGVARVLLSRLCRQVGYEMYEMDIAVRNLLLRELKEQFGQERLDDLADFLMDYVAQQLTEDDADTQDLREAQEWTALAYTKPDEAARELALALSEKVKQEDMGEVLRLTSLVETLAEPLLDAGFEPLLVYSYRMVSYFKEKPASINTQHNLRNLQEFLCNRDVFILVDQGSSMNNKDSLTGDKTRWQCLTEMLEGDIYHLLAYRGWNDSRICTQVNLHFFGDIKAESPITITDIANLEKMFEKNYPLRKKLLIPTLQGCVNSWLEKRSSLDNKAIFIIYTDGKIDDKKYFSDLLFKLALNTYKDKKIVFLMIGIGQESETNNGDYLALQKSFSFNQIFHFGLSHSIDGIIDFIMDSLQKQNFDKC